MSMNLNKLTLNQKLAVAAIFAFLMLLTRGSHVLTAVSLPDASLALFLLGGLLLGRIAWFIAFFLLASLIDFGAASVDSWQAFCLTDAYWGLIPAYGAVWLGGRWLASRDDPFAPVAYSATALASTIAAFIISTQTYYLFSGRFPNNGIMETIQYGWNYLPGYIGYSAIYFVIAWATVRILQQIRIVSTAQV
jgi:hypothetical protein